MAAWLKHPLVVVAVTAILSGILAPILVSRSQAHQHGLETKAQLAERVSDATAGFLGAVELRVLRGGVEERDFDAAYATWQAASDGVATRLLAQLRGGDPAAEWRAFTEQIVWLYYLFKTDAVVKPEFALRKLAAYLGPGNPSGLYRNLDGLVLTNVARGRTNKPYVSALANLERLLRDRAGGIAAGVIDASART